MARAKLLKAMVRATRAMITETRTFIPRFIRTPTSLFKLVGYGEQETDKKVIGIILYPYVWSQNTQGERFGIMLKKEVFLRLSSFTPDRWLLSLQL